MSLFEGFVLIAGPCVLEDDDLNRRIADHLAGVAERSGVPIVFKASFDKANRSRAFSPRGPGLDEGLRRLERVRQSSGLPTLTDIHEPDQAVAAADVVDVLQIPAFLCRQTDLLTAAGRTGRPVNVKKGQWMAPEEMAGAVEKVAGAGAEAVAITERGTMLGYGDLVVDMRSFSRVRAACGVPAFFDGTHSVQRPGRGDGVSGGDPEYVAALVLAAMAAGADGLFLEVHPEPRSAPSDATTMLELSALESLLNRALAVLAAARAGGGP